MLPRTGNMVGDKMPLIKPSSGEEKDKFIARCMADKETQAITGDNEADAQARRAAACYRQWDDHMKATTDQQFEAKSFGALEIKDASQGLVEAVIATLGVKDRDGDLIPLDAIESGAPATISFYDHDSIRSLMTGSGLPDAPPVGKGHIFVEGDKAVFRGNYFLETTRGLEAFKTFKALGENQDWSFGYRKDKVDKPTAEMRSKGISRVLSKLGRVAGSYEVSPVPMGGGVGTRTVAMKAADAESAAEDRTDKKTQSVDGVEHGREDFAFNTSDEPSEWKFPIFDAAHVRDALARLDQEKGIPDAEMATVRARIKDAAHKFGIDDRSLEPGKKSAEGLDPVTRVRVARAEAWARRLR